MLQVLLLQEKNQMAALVVINLKNNPYAISC